MKAFHSHQFDPDGGFMPIVIAYINNLEAEIKALREALASQKIDGIAEKLLKQEQEIRNQEQEITNLLDTIDRLTTKSTNEQEFADRAYNDRQKLNNYIETTRD